MTENELQQAIEALESKAETTNEIRILNYLRSNYEDVLDAFSD